jgi:hypothetical protein
LIKSIDKKKIFLLAGQLYVFNRLIPCLTRKSGAWRCRAMFKLPYGDFVWDSRLFEVDGEIVLHLGRVATAYSN